MSELDDIKARAATVETHGLAGAIVLKELLDRAIAIAEERLDPVDVGKSIGYLMADVEKARAAALALRDMLSKSFLPRGKTARQQLLSDTAWLEKE